MTIDNFISELEKLGIKLDDEKLFNEELKNGWREVAKKFGDERRTKIIQLAEGNDNEPIEKIVKYSHLPKEKVLELQKTAQ